MRDIDRKELVFKALEEVDETQSDLKEPVEQLQAYLSPWINVVFDDLWRRKRTLRKAQCITLKCGIPKIEELIIEEKNGKRIRVKDLASLNFALLKLNTTFQFNDDVIPA